MFVLTNKVGTLSGYLFQHVCSQRFGIIHVKFPTFWRGFYLLCSNSSFISWNKICRQWTIENTPIAMVACSNTESDIQGQKSCIVIQKARISREAYKFPELKERDLEETFTRGSGPGGQSVNKTANCVLLKHMPTGLFVKVTMTQLLNLICIKQKNRFYSFY